VWVWAWAWVWVYERVSVWVWVWAWAWVWVYERVSVSVWVWVCVKWQGASKRWSERDKKKWHGKAEPKANTARKERRGGHSNQCKEHKKTLAKPKPNKCKQKRNTAYKPVRDVFAMQMLKCHQHIRRVETHCVVIETACWRPFHRVVLFIILRVAEYLELYTKRWNVIDSVWWCDNTKREYAERKRKRKRRR
jgi:hypothetical protein